MYQVATNVTKTQLELNSLEGLLFDLNFAFGDTQNKSLLHKTLAPNLEEYYIGICFTTGFFPQV